jgi:hypothetical protein
MHSTLAGLKSAIENGMRAFETAVILLFFGAALVSPATGAEHGGVDCP